MQELLGRLTALDPEASDTLKVVSYFDALVANGVGVSSLLRGAAVLAGAPVGCRIRERVTRVAATGENLAPDAAAEARHEVRDIGSGVVWIERDGPAHANDAMVLERLGIALAITTARHSDGGGAVEIALSPHSSEEERTLALARLRLDVLPVLQATALPSEVPAPRGAASSIMVTPWGSVRAVIGGPDAAFAGVERGGRGMRGPRDRVHDSWTSALIALRLTTAAEPWIDAADLGALVLLAEAADGRHEPHPDAVALEALPERSLELLDALAETESVRAAAAHLGRHHSTVQQQAAALAESLGYDPRAPAGRVRYTLARTLLRLARPAL